MYIGKLHLPCASGICICHVYLQIAFVIRIRQLVLSDASVICISPVHLACARICCIRQSLSCFCHVGSRISECGWATRAQQNVTESITHMGRPVIIRLVLQRHHMTISLLAYSESLEGGETGITSPHGTCVRGLDLYFGGV